VCTVRSKTTNYTMKFDLLIKKYDYYCNLFIDGKIEYNLYQEIEKEYLKRKELFTIYLN